MASGAESSSDPELRSFVAEASVDVVAAKFYFDGGVPDEGNAALASVGVARELKVEGVAEVEMVEEVRFVNHGEDWGFFVVPFPGFVGVGMAAPDGVESGEEDGFTFDVNAGALVFEVADAGAFDFFFELARAAMPDVVVARAGEDAVGSGELFEVLLG